MKLTISKSFLTAALMCTGLHHSSAYAAANTTLDPDPPQSAAQIAQSDAAYTAGATALDQNHWQDAVADFDQVIKANGSKADAALYWKAYALNKLNNADLANATCRQLRTQFRISRWNRDCSTLHLTQQPGVPSNTGMTINIPPINIDLGDLNHGRGKDSSDPDADIKILALNSLMHRDPAQAMPLLRGILTGDQPASVKKHALFVLAQSKTPEADALMHDLVLGKMGVDLQRDAIQSSGIYRGKRNTEELAEAYRTTSDEQVKRAVISAMFIASDDVHLVEIARVEKNMEMKRRIVSQLAIMNGKAAQDYMLELLK